jgi:hypothetical protein
MNDTTKMSNMESMIQTLPDAIPFGNKALEGSMIANTVAVTMRLITTLATIASPPVCGVGVECSVLSFGWANIERNDLGEHKLLVIHEADTKANKAANMTIAKCIFLPLSD